MIRAWASGLGGALAMAAVFLGYHALTAPPRAVASAVEIRATAFWEARLPDLADRPQALAQWLGKVVVVNFWASCCQPCRREIPAFIALQSKHGGQGLQFVGVAMEAPEKARAYADQVGINYPILRGDESGEQLGRDAGNRMGGMPYTVVFDRQGNAVAAITGELAGKRLETLVAALL